jgi:hypothetical protein
MQSTNIRAYQSSSVGPSLHWWDAGSVSDGTGDGGEASEGQLLVLIRG